MTIDTAYARIALHLSRVTEFYNIIKKGEEMEKYSDKDREQINKIANYRVRNYKELIEAIEN